MTAATVNQVKFNDVPQTIWNTVATTLKGLKNKSLTETEAQALLGNVTSRECAYVVQALRFLGWVDNKRSTRPWPLSLNAEGKLAVQNEAQMLEDAWDLISSWSPAVLLVEGKESEALTELMSEGLGEVTAQRRLSTIKNWIKSLNPDKSAVVASVKNVRNLQDANQRYVKAIESINQAIPTLAGKLCEGRLTIEDMPAGTDVKVLAKARKFHHRFVKAVRKAYANSCVMSGSKLMVYASHIKPWAACSGEEKTDPENGLLLDERWDRLFDTGYVSFDDNGKVMLSPNVNKNEWSTRSITGAETLRTTMSDKTKSYMKYHRENVFKK